MTRIKICCISSVAEADLAIKYGASALGLVGQMPSGPGVISDVLIRDIVAQVPPPISTFLLSSETSAEGIISHYKRTQTSVIQIVDRIEFQEYHEIKAALPHVKIVQVVHVEDASSVIYAMNVSALVDAILLDSGKPSDGILGGTGQVHNWELSKVIVKKAQCSVFLAGGINPSNIARAISEVKPFGIDLCSGIRSNGKLDEGKLKELMDNVCR